MTVFGGRSQFGSAAFGGDPFGIQPSAVIDVMIAELSRFQLLPDGSGCVKTIGRLTGEMNDEESLERLLATGTPAMLVGYGGGTFQPMNQGTTFVQTCRFFVLCAASSMVDRGDRLAGRNIYAPAVDNMTRWAMYYAGRALLEFEALENQRIHEEKYLVWRPERFVAVVEFRADATIDWQPEVDPTAGVFERLGICHSPLDLDQLFLEDNLTPNTDDPTGMGVADLTE